jgi:alpha-beta hydrolase superfamily lysophospholipase
MTRHCRYVWESLIRKSPATSTALIAHSAGGMCTADLIERYSTEFFKRCEALVFTDAGYHSVFSSPKINKEMIKRLTEIGIHYKAYRKDHLEVGEVFS